MKKLLFTVFSILIVNCGLTINAQAQNSKIEDFIKKYQSQKGASYVEMSKAMLDAAFKDGQNNSFSFSSSSSTSSSLSVSASASASSNTPDKSNKKENTPKYPQKFKSLVLNDVSKTSELKNILSGKEYEVLMETRNNKVDNWTKESYASETTYYFHDSKKADEKEIIIVQQEGDKRLSLTYMQGNIDVSRMQNYLLRIRTKLSIMGVQSGLTSDLGFNSFNDYSFDFSGFQSSNNEMVLTGVGTINTLKEDEKSVSDSLK